MHFINRHEEMKRLDHLASRSDGGLAILYGRRRIGKTRLLLEWIRKHKGLYLVADQSSAEVQRKYLAEAVARKLPGFSEVTYPDWSIFLSRLAREAKLVKWKGPLVIDELPYLVTASPELQSVLQRWIDHEAREAGLVVALAGSSQRMMQGLVIPENAPLYGRAREIIHLGPLDPNYISKAFGTKKITALIEYYAAWGGVPRYWELAAGESGSILEQIDRLVLDPMGVLHQEPDRLLIEEHPHAIEIRPVLDAIGMGANRVSEIAGRIGHQATSLARPLDRIIGMGLVRREVPFGEPEKKSRRSLYRMADPFTRLWFTVVAPNRAFLANASPADRRKLLKKLWPAHMGAMWEELCRRSVVSLAESTTFEKLGSWGPASRWWRGNAPEWDLVAQSRTGKKILLGEAKWSDKAFSKAAIRKLANSLLEKQSPPLPGPLTKYQQIHALFIPQTTAPVSAQVDGVYICTGKDLLNQKSGK